MQRAGPTSFCHGTRPLCRPGVTCGVLLVGNVVRAEVPVIRRHFLVVVSAVASVVLVAPTEPSRAAVAPGVWYAADNAPRNLVVLQFNPARTTITRVTWLVDLACTPGPAPTGMGGPSIQSLEVLNIPVRKNGTWRKTAIVRRTAENGDLVVVTQTARGTRPGAKIKGTLTGSMTRTTTAGVLVFSCETTPAGFTLVQPNTFAGLTTAQQNPVAVTMNPARTKVTRFRWDWQGPCTPGPAATPETPIEVYFPDQLTGFPVAKSGAWGGTVDFPPFADPVSGITSSFRYVVRARRTGQTIKGTVNGSFIETNTASGAEIRRCASGDIAFTVKE